MFLDFDAVSSNVCVGGTVSVSGSETVAVIFDLEAVSIAVAVGG